MSPEPANRQEIDVLARRAGLKLTDEHLEELAQAYGYVEQMLIRLRRARSYADEPAHVFGEDRDSDDTRAITRIELVPMGAILREPCDRSALLDGSYVGRADRAN